MKKIWITFFVEIEIEAVSCVHMTFTCNVSKETMTELSNDKKLQQIVRLKKEKRNAV